MKKVTLTLVVLFVVALGGLQAQNDKRVESNLQLSLGNFIETTDYPFEFRQPYVKGLLYSLFTTMSLRLSYGLDIRMDEQLSLMPGAGLRAQTTSILPAIGGDIDMLASADAFCTLRYHLDAGKIKILLGLGPDVSFLFYQKPYYIDADPDDPLNGQKKFHNVDYSILPSLTFRAGEHWQWGLEGSIGLRNMRIQYPDWDVNYVNRFNSVSLTCGFHF